MEQERNTLLALDREWSASTKDTEKFLSYFAPDASAYPQRMPVATLSQVLNRFFEDSPRLLVLDLLGHERTDADELRRVRALIEHAPPDTGDATRKRRRR